jgi:hypothetical protein
MNVYLDPYTATTINHAYTAKLSNILGYGGYFWVKSVESHYESGKFDTEMECIWTSPGVNAPSGVSKVKTINAGTDENKILKNMNIRNVSDDPGDKSKAINLLKNKS